MPESYRQLPPELWPKGVENRNQGMKWVYDHVLSTGDYSGALYFADDDNTYDLRLFDEIRYTQTVSMFPVGFVSGLFVSTPILDENNTFSKFYTGWNGKRKFLIDMAGFAVGIKYFVEKSRQIQSKAIL